MCRKQAQSHLRPGLQTSRRSCGHPHPLCSQTWSPGDGCSASSSPWWSAAELHATAPRLCGVTGRLAGAPSHRGRSILKKLHPGSAALVPLHTRPPRPSWTSLPVCLGHEVEPHLRLGCIWPGSAAQTTEKKQKDGSQRPNPTLSPWLLVPIKTDQHYWPALAGRRGDVPWAVTSGKHLAPGSHLGPGFPSEFSQTAQRPLFWPEKCHVATQAGSQRPVARGSSQAPSCWVTCPLPGLQAPRPPTASACLCPLGCFLARELCSTSAVALC